MARIEGVAGESDSRTTLLIRRIIAYVVLGVLVFISLLPFYLLIINATRDKTQSGIQFYPGTLFGYNLKNVVGPTFLKKFQFSFFHAFFNSVLVSFFNTILSVYFSALTAYAIHVYDFRLKKPLHTFILIVMMVPTQASAIGLYRMLIGMKMTDSFIPLTVTGIAAPAVYFFMIQYMASSLPLEIVEAARIDGCGEFRTFNTIVLPILKPALAVQAIFVFVSSWNNLFLPEMLLDDPKKKTIPILIALIRSDLQTNQMDADRGLMYMVMVMAILPVVVVYLLLSKNIVGGVSLGAVKG